MAVTEAGRYQLYEPLDEPTEAALRASIRRFGVIVPVVVDQHGRIIDGHHRKRIADELGLRCQQHVRRIRSDQEAEELARTLNEDRRQLPLEQRREVVADLRQEGHSLRAIAGAVGVGKDTVAKDIEAEELSRGRQLTPDRVRGLDGKERPSARPTHAEQDEPALYPGEHDAIMDSLREAHGDDLTEADVEAALEENAESKKADWTPSKPDLGEGVSHPARYSSELLPIFRDLLETYSPGTRVLDPFAGTGRIHELQPDWETWGVEIEPEWANLHPSTLIGSALELPFETGEFDAIVTSPTYGNRLADHHNASDPERRRSYTHDLGRALHEDNSGSLQWGDDYRAFHLDSWTEALRVLRPSGVFLLNIKDHIRGHERQHVAGWHVTVLIRAGLELLCHTTVETRTLQQGENGHARLLEQVYVLRLP